MNSKLVTMLLSVCFVLILIIIGEWFYAERAQKLVLASSTPSDTKILHDKMPDIELTRQSEESYEDLAVRPLFIKGRKPVDEPTKEESLAADTANTLDDWVLSGVYTTKNGLSALFSRIKQKTQTAQKGQKEPKDNFRKISTGADLDGWKLKEIQKDRALLSHGAQNKELLLRDPRKPKDISGKPKMSRTANPPNIPNMANIPQPSEGTPEMIQPAEGELENNDE
jgi:hypothetical protein